MPATYEPIATTTLGSAASSITFSSIPGTYTDLRLVVVPTAASTSIYTSLRFNGDTSSNYSVTVLYGNGSTATSSRASSQTELYLNTPTSIDSTFPALVTVDLFSYAGSTNKTILSEMAIDKNGSGAVWRIVGLWRNTAAITSINFFSSTGNNFATGTTATLYGILKA